jgi:SEC-C motif domain protein
MACVCGKDGTTETCCGPIVEGKKLAATAEELMRARYAAYALGKVDFIMSSHDPDKLEEVDRDNTELWSKQSEWQGLEILSADKGGANDDTGTVEFVARYKIKGMNVSHHERAQFRKHAGKWVFVDGEEVAPPPMHRDEPRIGRNDPCPCGSGKKYKKCCGQTARAG